MFFPGDIVRCIDPTEVLRLNAFYEVLDAREDNVRVKELAEYGGWYPRRFELVMRPYVDDPIIGTKYSDYLEAVTGG